MGRLCRYNLRHMKRYLDKTHTAKRFFLTELPDDCLYSLYGHMDDPIAMMNFARLCKKLWRIWNHWLRHPNIPLNLRDITINKHLLEPGCGTYSMQLRYEPFPVHIERRVISYSRWGQNVITCRDTNLYKSSTYIHYYRDYYYDTDSDTDNTDSSIAIE